MSGILYQGATCLSIPASRELQINACYSICKLSALSQRWPPGQRPACLAISNNMCPTITSREGASRSYPAHEPLSALRARKGSNQTDSALRSHRHRHGRSEEKVLGEPNLRPSGHTCGTGDRDLFFRHNSDSVNPILNGSPSATQ